MKLRRRRPYLAACWIAAALCVGLSGPARADRALLIGINDYYTVHPDPPPNCPGDCVYVGPLNGAVADTAAMKALLVDKMGYAEQDIRIITDHEATGDRILQEVREWLVAGTRPGERAFFQYSGHGIQVPDDSGDEADGWDEAIVPIDVTVDQQGNVSRLLRDDQLESAFAGLEGRLFTALFDSCHSGTVTRSVGLAAGDDSAERTPMRLQAALRDSQPLSRGPAATLRTRAAEPTILDSRPGWTVWSAASANQPAWDVSNPPGGVFTRFWIPAVSEGRLDTLTHQALIDRLQSQSAAYCERNQRCQGLIPTLEVSSAWLPESLGRSLLGTAPGPEPAVEAVADTVLPDNGEAAGQQDVPPVTVTITPGTRLRLGDTVRFEVSSPIDGELLLLDATADGKLVQIFPNTYHEGRTVRAGRAITIPDDFYGFEFPVEPPLGVGRIIAVVSDGQADLSDLVTAERGLDVVPEARDFLTEIAARLRKAYLDGESVRLPKWSVGVVDYRIEASR